MNYSRSFVGWLACAKCARAAPWDYLNALPCGPWLCRACRSFKAWCGACGWKGRMTAKEPCPQCGADWLDAQDASQ